MDLSVTLPIVAFFVFLVNLPFGYWRASVPKRSPKWFLAIHIPVPFVIAIRMIAGIGFAPVSYPVIAIAFFLGQFVGGRLRSFAVTPQLQPVEVESSNSPRELTGVMTRSESLA